MHDMELQIHAWYIALIAIVAFLLLLRILTPSLVRSSIKRSINNKRVSGSVGDVSLSIIAGKVRILNIEIKRVDLKLPLPRVLVREIVIAARWRDLIRARVGLDILIRGTEIMIVSGPGTPAPETTPADPVVKERARLALITRIAAHIRVGINTFRIERGIFSYENLSTSPTLSAQVIDLDFELSDLWPHDIDTVRMARGTLNAYLLGGRLSVEFGVDPLHRKLLFDGKASLSEVPLEMLGDITEAFAKCRPAAGSLSARIEARTVDGRIEGSLEPVVCGAEFLRDHASIIQYAYTMLLNRLSSFLAAGPRGCIATSIGFGIGEQGIRIGIWNALKGIIGNWRGHAPTAYGESLHD